MMFTKANFYLHIQCHIQTLSSASYYFDLMICTHIKGKSKFHFEASQDEGSPGGFVFVCLRSIIAL